MSEKKKENIPNTLQGQAWKRATSNSKPNAGTPHDWEDYEKMTEKKKDKSSKGQWHGGKGSIQKSTDQEKYADAWEKIFGKDKGPSKFDKQGPVHYRDGDNT